MGPLFRTWVPKVDLIHVSCSPLWVKYANVSPSVLELLPLAVVSGGQVQIRWAGLVWRWPNAKPNLTSGTKLLVNIARNAKLSLPIMILPENAKPQESAHQESAHVYAVFVAKMAFARFDGQV